jgi:hypothetical protein
VKQKPVLSEKIYVRLTTEEHAMLTEIAKRLYSHARGAQSLAVRSLIRSAYQELQDQEQEQS